MCRRSGQYVDPATDRRRTLPAQRFGDRGEEHHRAVKVDPMLGPGPVRYWTTSQKARSAARTPNFKGLNGSGMILPPTGFVPGGGRDFSRVSDRACAPVDDNRPLLDAQAASSEARCARGARGSPATANWRLDDPQLAACQNGPGRAQRGPMRCSPRSSRRCRCCWPTSPR